MLFPNLTTIRVKGSDNLVSKYKYICVCDTNLVVEKNGQRTLISLDDISGINNSDAKVDIVIVENLIGLRVDSKIFFHTNHAVDKAISRSLIKDKKSFIFLANSVLKDKNIRNKNDYKMVFSIAKHGESAIYYIDEIRDCVMVVSNGLILTTYRYHGSAFYKEK